MMLCFMMIGLYLTGTADPRDLQCRTGSQSVLQWARKNIGDSHKEKRKHML
jgi:hypothetical protein